LMPSIEDTLTLLLIMSHHVSSCLIMSHHVSSCLIMSRHVSSCLVMTHHVFESRVLTCLTDTSRLGSQHRGQTAGQEDTKARKNKATEALCSRPRQPEPQTVRQYNVSSCLIMSHHVSSARRLRLPPHLCLIMTLLHLIMSHSPSASGGIISAAALRNAAAMPQHQAGKQICWP
jgi:hypothetical protein